MDIGPFMSWSFLTVAVACIAHEFLCRCFERACKIGTE